MTETRTKKWVDRLKWFASEFIVVVAGILVAFSINTWWQDVETSRREKEYLQDLALDFEENRYRLQEAIKTADDVVDAAQILLSFETAEQGKTLGVDSLNELVGTLSYLPTFDAVTRTYDNILGAGELRVLSNADLRMSLADFESQLRLVGTVEQTQERQYVSIYEPYILENLDYLAIASYSSEKVQTPAPTHAGAILEVLGTRKFRNWVVVRLAWADDLRTVHTVVLDLVKEIEGALSEN